MSKFETNLPVWELSTEKSIGPRTDPGPVFLNLRRQEEKMIGQYEQVVRG
jgi:hypothetical protein